MSQNRTISIVHMGCLVQMQMGAEILKTIAAVISFIAAVFAMNY